MIVNYVKECMAFIAYASDNKVSANEFVLWHALFNAINQRATSNDWPNEFIPVSNSRLLSLTTFGAGKTGEETLRKTRDKLIQRGLIRYIAGEKNKKNPSYIIVFFSSYTDSGGNVTQEKKGNTQGNVRGNMQGNTTGNMQGIIRKPNVTKTDIHTASTPPQNLTQARGEYVREDGSTAPTRYDRAFLTSERARRAVAQRLLDGFGGQIDTGNIHGALCDYMQQGMAPEIIEDAAANCSTTGELEARLYGLSIQLGVSDEQQRRELAQCRLASGGNEQLAQALLRLRQRGTGTED